MSQTWLTAASGVVRRGGLAVVLLLAGRDLLGAGRPVLGTIASVQALGNADAQAGYPVRLQGVVTYSDPEWGLLFMADRTGSVYIDAHGSTTEFAAGTRIRVDAVTAAGHVHPVIAKPVIRVVGAGALKAPVPVTLSELDSGLKDSSFVVAEGVLRPGGQNWDRIAFRIVDGDVWGLVIIPRRENEEARRLIGARVRVRGVSAARLDQGGRRVGAQLFVTSLENIEVIERSEPASAATQSIRTLISSEAVGRFAMRAHVQGTVTWESPSRLFVDDGSGAICVELGSNARVPAGTTVDVLGFPEHGPYGFALADVTLRRIDQPVRTDMLSALPVTAAQIIERRVNGKTVHLRARLIEQSTTAKQHSFLLEDGPHRFRAVLPRTSADEVVHLPHDAVLDVTGIVLQQREKAGAAASVKSMPFLVLIGSPANVVVSDGMGWVTFQRIISLLGGIAVLALCVLGWITQLRRTVRRQTGTIRARLERELQLETRYKRLFERNLAGVFLWRPDGLILDCNPSFAKMLGFSSTSELVGRSYWDLQTDSTGAQAIRDALAGSGLSNRDANLKRADGGSVSLIENISAVTSDEGVVYETTAIDVTQLRLNQAALQKAKEDAECQALNDALTGLPNRRLLSEKLSYMSATARREGKYLALLYIDLDGFKLVNDSLGHSTGDALLVQVAARLQGRVRASDALARLGGDEFIVVLSGLSSKREASKVADDILRVLSEPFEIEDHEILIGGSIGISLFPENAEVPNELLQQADSAMYAAKREGKNRAVFFTAELGSSLRERLNLESQLRGAIGRNEITVQYQPEFDAVSGDLVRFEALARWSHPTLGQIPPDKFIPIAEDSGLIVSLGAYILEEACTEAVKWQEQSEEPIQVAVNVSSIQFRRESLADEVIDILNQTGLSPHLLQLELTESVMMTGNQLALATMQRLRAAGISLAIDDFGTGYSCLSSLQSSPFDALKVDRSFVKQIGVKNGGEAMVHSVVALAHNIGMRVIVEGIETEKQLHLIRALGGDEVQGFYMGRPTVSPSEVISEARSKRRELQLS